MLVGEVIDRSRIIDMIARCPYLWYRWYSFVDRKGLVEFHADRIARAQGLAHVRTLATEGQGRLTSLVQVSVLEWDTKHFGLTMAAGQVYGAGEGTEPTLECYRDLLDHLDRHCYETGIEHMSIAADGEDLGLIQAANLAGFVLVACNTNHFFIPSKDRLALPPDKLAGDVRGLRPGDLAEIAPAAREMFRWTRFHADPWLDGSKCDELYAERVVQLAGDATTARVYVVERHGRPVAFMPVRVLMEAGIRVAILDLTVILPEARGLYYHLLLHALHDVVDVDVIEMSTDARNLTVRNTWAKLGLMSFGTRVYLHKRYKH